MQQSRARDRSRFQRGVRDLLQINTGDQVEFAVTERGDVVLRGISLDITEIKGLLKRPRRRVSVEAMNDAILRKHARKR